MRYFYDKTSNGFYLDEIHLKIPGSAVEISENLYLSLLEGQSQGKQIISGKNGVPTLCPAQPSEAHEWNGEKWIINKYKAAELKAKQQAEVWEQIKQRRHNNLRGGVYIKSVDKWFHSNDESRQQYTFLRTFDKLPNGMTWKTMENVFVPFTKAILDELSLQLISDEQADFKNAERHKSLMEQAENPLDYDFSDGWTPIFTEVTQ